VGRERGRERRSARALARVVPKRELIRAEITTAHVLVASPPECAPGVPSGTYALALVDAVLYLARCDEASDAAPRQARLRLAEAELALAFGGPPHHSTLHFEHPVVGRLVVSLPTIEFATLTEAAVERARRNGGW
jgi:hypothetical protein